MPTWLVSLTYPLGDEDIGAFSGAGIVRRAGRTDISQGAFNSATFELDAESEDDARAKVLAVRPEANITRVHRVG